MSKHYFHINLSITYIFIYIQNPAYYTCGCLHFKSKKPGRFAKNLKIRLDKLQCNNLTNNIFITNSCILTLKNQVVKYSKSLN